MKIKRILFFILLAAIVLTIPGPGELQLLAAKSKAPLTLVIDAGHGGADGGAEAADGTQEAELNLAIAKAIQSEGEKKGVKVIMTRETADGLYGEGNLEKHWRKLEDMKCRKEIIASSGADVAVTIHMNCFKTDGNVRGAQVFYPKTGNAEILSASESLAGSIQSALIKGLDDGSNRSQMGRGQIYLLENPTIPTVLVECGFLSNPEDLGRLKQEKWQQKIAECILEGILACIEI